MKAMMNKTCAGLALTALVLCAGCSGRLFEPTANWWRDGGRLCAAARDTSGLEWRRAAARSCAPELADAPPAQADQGANDRG